jgi:hypoxanthine-guanine phosphoribosyltransferase
VTQAELEKGVQEILIDETALQARIVELGAEISADYAGRTSCSSVC